MLLYLINAKNLEKYQENISIYQKNCLHCNKAIDYSHRLNNFCNHSCSANYSNNKRIENGYIVSSKTKDKILTTLTATLLEKGIIVGEKHITEKIKEHLIIFETPKTASGPFSQIYECNCNHCGLKFFSRLKKKYCNTHRNLYSISAKQGYKFTFNIYHYPKLFDLKLLKQIGWFSPGGRAGKWNPNGLSRDHRISVIDAILNNYDPYYITHPLNCELMPHTENNKKKTKSSITYDELKNMVDEYNLKIMLFSPEVGLEPTTK